MKKHLMKACCAVLAASMLLSGCGNQPVETTESSTAATTPAATTSAVETTTETTSLEQTTSGAETTTETTTEVTTPEETTTETTFVTETTSYLPVVDASKYGTTTMTEDELYDKMVGGWIGQMVGVAWCASTEFAATGSLLPVDRFPAWKTSMIKNAFGQDDVYVEIPFLDAMKENGAFCDISCLADTFRHSTFPLWHANVAGRDNLRAGLEAPASGHYAANVHADDIDWQIECDFLGQMYPGMPNEAAARAFELGHIMNYGDGCYGGAFVSAMHAAAYTAKSVVEIVETGISVIPENTKFRTAMDIVMAAYNKGSAWDAAWYEIEAYCGTTDKCPEGFGKPYNIDAVINSAYIIIGLLWGEGDFAKTIEISCRCGQDSDCNPSSAASILGNYIGASAIPDIYKTELNYDSIFSSTDYSLTAVLDLNTALTEEVITAYGATLENGTWTLKTNLAPETVPYEQWPDGFGVGIVTGALGNGAVRLYSRVTGDEALASITLDMGDGNVLNELVPVYAYAKTGKYTVKISAVGANGSTFEDEIEVIVKADINATVIGSDITTANSGSSDISVLYDGLIPYKGAPAIANPQVNFSSADGNVYAGLQFDKTYVIKGLKFVEGTNVAKGGWFAEAPTIEVLVGGEWKTAELRSSTEYPIGKMSVHRDPYEVYRFNFANPIACDGVRIVGKHDAGSFVSVAELAPIYDAFANFEEFDTNFMAIITDEPSPTGSGSRNIALIADGKIGNSNATQYDTYDGSTGDRVEYFGYLFSDTTKVNAVEFAEGGHFAAGGWFKNGDVRIEALIDGVWTKVETTVSPAYPNANDMAAFGKSYETYTFTLTAPTECDGIRIIGLAGGDQSFISISELTVK